MHSRVEQISRNERLGWTFNPSLTLFWEGHYTAPAVSMLFVLAGTRLIKLFNTWSYRQSWCLLPRSLRPFCLWQTWRQISPMTLYASLCLSLMFPHRRLPPPPPLWHQLQRLRWMGPHLHLLLRHLKNQTRDFCCCKFQITGFNSNPLEISNEVFWDRNIIYIFFFTPSPPKRLYQGQSSLRAYAELWIVL